MQKLSLDRHLSSGMMGSQATSRSPSASPTASPKLSASLVKVCQRQLTQLVEQLPLLGAWLVFRDRPSLLGNRHRMAVVREERPGFDPQILSEIESELWLHEYVDGDRQNVPPYLYFYALVATDATDKSDIENSGELLAYSPGSNSANFAAIAPQKSLSFNGDRSGISQDSPVDEYLLLWAHEPLSTAEQQATAERVELIGDYLVMMRDYHRQQEEIQLLEIAIGRSEHQLRNYLGMIGLYAQNLNWGLSDTFLKEQAQIIGDTVRTMSENLTQLLNYTKPKKNRIKVQKFHQIIEKIYRLFENKLTEKPVVFSWEKSPLEFEFEPWQMEQVFENLLSNAIEFSPPGGIVNCEWKLFRNEVMIKMSDRGPGFAPEYLKNAFTPYYSKRPGGTGLGLAIAKKIILDHQGSIWLENLPEGGGQVSVVLPRYAR
jgi:signal transduction histidine kinase